MRLQEEGEKAAATFVSYDDLQNLEQVQRWTSAKVTAGVRKIILQVLSSLGPGGSLSGPRGVSVLQTQIQRQNIDDESNQKS